VSGFFAPEFWLFSLAVALLIGVAVAEGMSLLIGASPLHWLGGDVADTPDGVPGGALGWLHFGRLPLLVILVIFLTTFALSGFAIQFAARGVTGLFLPLLAAAPLAGVAAVFAVRVFGGALARIMPKDETTAVPDASLVGRVGSVVIGAARAGRPAQARVRDQHGTSHYVMVEPEGPDQVLEAGASILLVRHLNGRRFHAIPNPKPELL
jgi:Inner membrane protein YqiJ, OB-fold/Inner membrane protein YqiJ, N-terminal